MTSARCALAAISLAVILTAGVSAAQPAPDCFKALLNMSDCLTFVEQGSNLTHPDKPCCAELAGLVDTNPICLCRLVGNGGSFGVRIELSRAKMLPDVCHVITPPLNCSDVGGPSSSSPAASPSGSADGATPATANKDSEAWSLKDSALVLLTCLVSGFVHLLV